MNATTMKRGCLAVICAVILAGAGASAALAAPSDPLWLFTPNPGQGGLLPPPRAEIYGPCGLGVDSTGAFYVSDYYHDVIDKYEPNAAYGSTNPRPSGATGYLGQVPGTDPADGPCALAFDGSDNLYANVFHRSVVKYGAGVIDGQGIFPTHPTGVAADTSSGLVYVDDRTYVAVYDSSGSPLMDGAVPLRIGALQDGYGVAVSQFPGSAGRLYVPDAGTNTVKVYDPAVSKANPVETIDGSETPPGEFVSLRDASVGVDRVTGEIYVVDNLQPVDTEKPRAIVDVFAADGSYEGHLKFLVVDALPAGLAVDNSPSATSPIGTQGRVYVTSGNTEGGSIYAYPPGAATTAPIKLPTAQLSLASVGAGAGTLSAEPGELRCSASCAESVPAGSQVQLEAQPASESTFAGWSGACSGSEASCTVYVEEAATVRAEFEPAPPVESTARSDASAPSRAAQRTVAERRAHRRHHRPRHGKRSAYRRHRGGAAAAAER
jgi:List-Bact-rpt repeat protein